MFQVGRFLRVEIRMLPLVDGGTSDFSEPTKGFLRARNGRNPKRLAAKLDRNIGKRWRKPLLKKECAVLSEA